MEGVELLLNKDDNSNDDKEDNTKVIEQSENSKETITLKPLSIQEIAQRKGEVIGEIKQVMMGVRFNLSTEQITGSVEYINKNLDKLISYLQEGHLNDKPETIANSLGFFQEDTNMYVNLSLSGACIDVNDTI